MEQADPGHYVVISADCHGGGDLPDYRPYLPSAYLDGRSTRGRRPSTTRIPTCTAPTAVATGTATAGSQELEADGVVGRGDLPQHHPARSSRRPRSCTSRPRPTRATSSCGGPGCRPTTGGWPTSARETPGRRAGIAQILLHDVDAAVEEIRWADGGRAHRRRPAPGRAARLGPAPALRAGLRADLGGVRGARHARQPPQRQRRTRLRRLPRGQGHVPPRGHVVGAPHALAPDLRRRARAAPRPAASSFTEQGTAWLPEQLQTLDYYIARMSAPTRLAGGRVRRRGDGEAVAARRASTGPASATSDRASSAPPRSPLRHRVGVDRIMWGSDFPHREGCWPVQPGAPAAVVRRRRPGRGASRWSAATPPRSTASTSTRSRPSPRRSARRVDEVAQPLGRPSDDLPDDALRCPVFAAARLAAEP